jgi:sugar lactone lactonase YvrE
VSLPSPSSLHSTFRNATLPLAEGSNPLLVCQIVAEALPYESLCAPELRQMSGPQRWSAALLAWQRRQPSCWAAQERWRRKPPTSPAPRPFCLIPAYPFPFAVAADGSGNIYITDTYNNRVLKETLSGGAYTESVVASGLVYPTGVAVNGIGNAYIADTYNNRVLKETLSGGAYTESTVASGLSFPCGLAVDVNGNLYIADTRNSRVLKETLSDGVYTESTVGSGLFHPWDVAVDGSGTLYIGDSDNNRVLKETLS